MVVIAFMFQFDLGFNTSLIADLIAIGRRVVIGNSPLLKSYSAKAPVIF